MNHKSSILASLTLAILATGCGPPDPTVQRPAIRQTNSVCFTNPLTNAKEGATNAWANTKATALQAWADIKESLGPAADFTYDQKEEFVAKASADLGTLDRKIAEISNQAAKVTESARDDAQVKLQALRNKRVQLGQRLDNVKSATAADWNDAKTAFKNSYNDVKNYLQQTWQWFSDKLNP